jgi:hypothetical protein
MVTDVVTRSVKGYPTMVARTLVAVMVFAAALGVGSGAGFAQVQVADGLVNVQIGDVTILRNVDVDVAAQVAANICHVQVGPVVVLGEAVDAGGGDEVVCVNRQGPITITDN